MSLDRAITVGGFGDTGQPSQSQVAAFAQPGLNLLPAAKAPTSAPPGSMSLSLDTLLDQDANGHTVKAAGTMTLTPQPELLRLDHLLHPHCPPLHRHRHRRGAGQPDR